MDIICDSKSQCQDNPHINLAQEKNIGCFIIVEAHALVPPVTGTYIC